MSTNRLQEEKSEEKKKTTHYTPFCEDFPLLSPNQASLLQLCSVFNCES